MVSHYISGNMQCTLLSTLVAGSLLFPLLYSNSICRMWWFKRQSRHREIPPKDDVLTSFGDASSNALPRRLEILVWNMEKGLESSFDVEYRHLVAQGKQLVLLQEYLGTIDVQQTLLHDPIIRYDCATSFYYTADDDRNNDCQTIHNDNRILTGVVNGSLAEATHVEAFVTLDVEPIVRTPKASIVSRYTLMNGTLHSTTEQATATTTELMVVNTHGINRASFVAFQNQIQQLASVIRQHSGPVIWAGDFNTNTQSKLTFLMELVIKDLGMTEVSFLEDNRIVSKLSRLPLDWIFVKGMKIEDSHVPVSTGSDHNPLLVTVSF